MLLSLTVYTLTGAIMAWLGWHVSHREQRMRTKADNAYLPFLSWEIIMAILIYVAVSAARWLTSWDYNMYYGYFVSMQSLDEYSRQNFEPGFALISKAIARAGCHFSMYFAFWAMLHISLLYYALRRRKVLLPWLALCIFFGPYYIQWMNTIRQAVVECLFILMVELIIRRKFWLYLLLSLLAMTIHRMSILLIPLYFLPLLRVSHIKSWMLYVFMIACAVLGQFPQWIEWIFESVGKFANLLGYGHYYMLFSSNNLEYVFKTWMGPARIFPIVTCFFFIWYYPSMQNAYKGDKFLSAAYRFSLLHIAFLNVFANTTLYLRRPGDLLRGVFLVMVCITLHFLWRERKWVPFAVLAFLNLYFIFYELFKVAIAPDNCFFPQMYHTFLF